MIYSLILMHKVGHRKKILANKNKIFVLHCNTWSGFLCLKELKFAFQVRIKFKWLSPVLIKLCGPIKSGEK